MMMYSLWFQIEATIGGGEVMGDVLRAVMAQPWYLRMRT